MVILPNVYHIGTTSKCRDLGLRVKSRHNTVFGETSFTYVVSKLVSVAQHP